MCSGVELRVVFGGVPFSLNVTRESSFDPPPEDPLLAACDQFFAIYTH
jgi:hypothetical protein